VGTAANRLVVLVVVLVDLLLQFHGSLVERVVLVGNGSKAGLAVEEIFVDSRLVEMSRLVGQGYLEVVSVGQVNLDSVLVVFVVLVFQSLLEVLLVRQVSLSLAVVENVLSRLVVMTSAVFERFLQVFRLAEVFQDGEVVELVFLVNERVVVKFKILEFLRSNLPQATLSFLVLSQKDMLVFEAVLGAVLRARLVDFMGRGGRQWCLREAVRWLGNRSGRLTSTSLEVLEIFPSFKRGVITSLQVHVGELASSKVVVDFPSLDIVLCLASKGESKCGSTEKGNSKESDFGSVLHDDLVIRTCV